jgi:hypothetical protein
LSIASSAAAIKSRRPSRGRTRSTGDSGAVPCLHTKAQRPRTISGSLRDHIAQSPDPAGACSAPAHFAPNSRPLHVTDKRLAEEKARRLITELELGGDPASQERAKREPVETLIDEFIDGLVSRTGLGHRTGHEKRLRKIAVAIGAKTLQEFDANRCEAWLRGSGLAARTKHHYTRMLKQFGRFLLTTHRVRTNPFAGLPTITGTEQDRKLRRRALTEEEIAKLLEHLPNMRYPRLGLTGHARAVLYRVVLVTGLRRDEAASRTPESFRLDADRSRSGFGRRVLSRSVSGRSATPRRENPGKSRGFVRFSLKRECIGIELPQNPQGKPHFATQAAQKAAHSTDPDLAPLIAGWADLPELIKGAIRALVASAAGSPSPRHS